MADPAARDSPAAAADAAAPDASPASALEAELSCPLCMRVFLDPVALACGHTIDRACLRRALALRAQCPLCRAPCFLQAEGAARNHCLAAVVGALFPAEAALRRADFAREEEELASQRIGFFLVPGTSLRLLPGMPVELIAFEPRNVLLVERCMESGAMFAVTAEPEDLLGAAVRVESCRRLANGRLHVSGAVRSRFRCLAPAAVEEGTGGLFFAQVRFFDDEAPAVAGPAALDAERLAATVPEAQRLSRRSRAAILRPALSEPQACALLRDALAEALVRICAALSHHQLQRLHARYGSLPGSSGPAASPERWSYFATAVLLLDVADRAACIETTSTLRRLVVVFAALEQAQREMRVRGTAVAAAAAAADVREGVGGGGDDADHFDAGAEGLRPLAGVEADPERVLDMLGGDGGGAGARGAGALLEAAARLLARSPVLRSFLVLVGCVAMLFFLRNSRIASE